MELVRNVFFNTDKLIRDETVKISYTGELSGNFSDKDFNASALFIASCLTATKVSAPLLLHLPSLGKPL